MKKITHWLHWAAIGLILVLLFGHVLQWELVRVDSTALVLVAFLLLSPFIQYIKKIKFGDFEAEISPNEIAELKAKVSTEMPKEPQGEESDWQTEILELVKKDPQLGLAKVRIEIEQSLSKILRQENVNDKEQRTLSIGRMVDLLVSRQILQNNIARAIRDVLPIANRAVHGESIRGEDAIEIARLAIVVIKELRQISRKDALEPVEATPFPAEEAKRLQLGRYRVTTVVPLIPQPEKRVYILDQDGLEELVKGYEEYAEFIISIESLRS